MINDKFKFIVSCCLATSLTAQSFPSFGNSYLKNSRWSYQIGLKTTTYNLKIVQLLDRISKIEDVYFVYSDKTIEDVVFENVDLSKAQLKNLPEILRLKNLKMVKVNNKQFIIQSIGSPKPRNNSSSSLSEVQQQRTIVGTVVDSQGKNLSGVTVKDIEGNISVSTDGNGKFEIKSAVGNTLSFHSIGYKNQSVTVFSLESLRVILEEKSNELQEVVVVGYGSQKKSDLTGSVGVVDVAKSMTSRPVTNVQELLAGSIPGLNVSKGSGAVGSGASVNIRGTSTIGKSSGTLVLIDGVPGNINTLNPNDIESISVLKDAASASIYGSRAANGVILVTTKSGQALDKLTINISSSVGFQSPQFMIDFVGAEDFMKLWDQALINDGKPALYGQQGLEDLRNGKYGDVKWYEEIYKKNSAITNNYLAFSGNTEKMKYRFSASHDYQDGTLPNNNYNRIILKPDMTFKITENLSARANIQYTETYINAPQGETDVWQTQATRVAPIYKIRNAAGQFGPGSAMVNNPIAGVYESGFNKQKYKELMGIFEVAYKPINGMELKANFSRYTFDNWSKNRVLSYNLYNDAGEVATVQNRVTNLTDAVDNSYRNMLQFTGDYGFNIDKHNFKVLVGYSQEYFNTSNFSAFRDALPFADIDELNTGGQGNMQSKGDAKDVAIQSFFSRLNYDFNGKYLFQANLRADGSSRFAKGHRWGVFPSFSAGWNVHKEGFFHSDVITNLKARASWGILGDAEKVDYYATSAILTYDPAMYGFNGVVVPGALNNVSINPTISWEESKQTNFAIDLGLLNKINFTAEYFINKRSNILYAPPVPLEFGLGGPLANLLSMESKGMEFQLGYQDRKNDWNWFFNANTSYATNKVKDLAGTGPWIGNSTFTDVGHTYNLPYGYRAIGLFKSEEEIKNSPSQGTNVFPGNIKFEDVNGDGQINGDDRVILRDKPVIRFGFNLGFGWKNIDVSMTAMELCRTPDIFRTMRAGHFIFHRMLDQCIWITGRLKTQMQVIQDSLCNIRPMIHSTPIFGCEVLII
ncbi:SusC/RagA family TonB-linked outer membrane protein [Sphingobacterium multivorum]|uniref:SusC/RagA family TonB-linked outer membrane protein n=1 Tax=Sphingobacterium multivorum TaxID=28454 RepID=UPI0030165CD5